MTLKQGSNTHSKFIDQLKDGEDTATSNYCYECPGCQLVGPAISISDLTEMIYLQGIDQEKYKFFFELEFSKSVMNIQKTPVWDLLGEFSAYTIEKGLDDGKVLILVYYRQHWLLLLQNHYVLHVVHRLHLESLKIPIIKIINMYILLAMFVQGKLLLQGQLLEWSNLDL